MQKNIKLKSIAYNLRKHLERDLWGQANVDKIPDEGSVEGGRHHLFAPGLPETPEEPAHLCRWGLE